VDPGASPIEIRLLGPVELRVHGSDVPLGGPRQRVLLALLALRAGQSVPTGELIEDVWAGDPTDAAETTIRSYVSRLRHALGGTAEIDRTDRGYVLHVPPGAVDAVEFERLIRDGVEAVARGAARRARTALAHALALWRGRPFGEVGDDGTLAATAQRLEELWLLATEQRVEADLALGASTEVIDELERLLVQNPFRERLWHHLMVALYRAGRQADALAAFHRARAALDEHLGIEPGLDLRELEQAILRQDVPLPRSSATGDDIPVSLTTFVGRQAELSEVRRLLDQSRLLTFAGVGGVGKTRLAIEALRQLAPDYDDGGRFIDLSPVADERHVFVLVASTFGIREQVGTTIEERLFDAAREVRALLVLDNCEHLRTTVARLAAGLLSAAPGIRIIATSRELLGVPGETVYEVPPLRLADGLDDVAAARASEAVRLFFERARESRPDLPDDDAVVQVVARICADLDGLPLGIELAAARARALAPREIAARLHDRFKFLVSWRRITPARHRTLREAMDWSYGLLVPEEQRLLGELSVFAGGCTLEAVAAVAMDDDEDRALEVLERLVEASLIRADTAVEPTRYRLLETVRQYGASVLEEASGTTAAKRRHADHFTQYAARISLPFRSVGVQQEWILRVTPDWDNFRAAITWAREHEDWPALLTIAESLWWLSWIRGEMTEAREWLELGIAHGAGVGPELLARAHLGAAGLAWAQDDDDAAERHGEAALAGFVALGQPWFEGVALNTLGLLAHRRHQQERARSLFESAIACFERSGEADRATGNIAVATDNLASVAHELHDDVRSRALYSQALEMNRARGDVEGLAMNNLHLGILDAEQGLWADARVRIESALRHYRAIGFLQYAAECLESTSMIANRTGSPTTAAFVLGVASRVRELAGSPPVPFMAVLRDRELDAARAALGESAVEATLAEGRNAGPEAGMERALEFLTS
jgi:predicted ATPase/DNA-binding SARP family transcriptional activator